MKKHREAMELLDIRMSEIASHHEELKEEGRQLFPDLRGWPKSQETLRKILEP